MGKRGPRPTPTPILKLRGSTQARYRPEEVQPSPGAPARPDWLEGEALAKWNALAPELSRLGLLTVVDGEAFAAYCSAWAELRHATETLEREGHYIGEGGLKRSHPAVAQQRSAWTALQRLGSLFGLSPSDRVGLAAPDAGRPKRKVEARAR